MPVVQLQKRHQIRPALQLYSYRVHKWRKPDQALSVLEAVTKFRTNEKQLTVANGSHGAPPSLNTLLATLQAISYIVAHKFVSTTDPMRSPLTPAALTRGSMNKFNVVSTELGLLVVELSLCADTAMASVPRKSA